MKIAITIALLLLSAPASAKVWIMQFGSTYEVWETRRCPGWDVDCDYPIQGRIATEREARQIAKQARARR